MSIAKMTLIGLLNYFNTQGVEGDLFDYLNLPEGIDKNTVINNIIMKGGEFETLYPNADYLRAYIGVWSNKWYRTFDKWITALNIEYNPLDNFDRHEEYTNIGSNDITRSGTRNNTTSGTNTITNTGNQTNTTTYNSSNIETKSGRDTTTRTDDLEEVLSIDHDNSIIRNSEKENITNGIVSQSKNTTNNQTRTETNINNSSKNTHEVSAFNSSTPVFDNSDTQTGGNTNSISYSGQPDNETTNTSVSYPTGIGDKENINSSETTNELGTDTKTNTGTSTNEVLYNSSITNSKSGTDSDRRVDDLTETHTNSITESGTDSDITSGSNRLTHTGHLYGNIGVTTSQQMLQSELDIAKWNLYDNIADIFINEFCIQVY